jgi:hypothetical protein
MTARQRKAPATEGRRRLREASGLRHRCRESGCSGALQMQISYGPGQNPGNRCFFAMPSAAKKATARGANATAAVSHLLEVTDPHAWPAQGARRCIGELPRRLGRSGQLVMLTDIIEAYELRR